MKKFILSKLLFHANRYAFGVYDKDVFYSIKNDLLEKYGKPVIQDVQFIEGKICHSCAGTGRYRKHNYRYGYSYWTGCWNCTNGWYKLPFWSLLDRVQFGRYEFHRPVRRFNDASELLALNPATNSNIAPRTIHGYIRNKHTYLSETAVLILVWMYRPKDLKEYSRGCPSGWKINRLLPKFLHIYYYGKDSIPVSDLIDWKGRKIQKFKDITFNFLNFFRRKIEAIQLKVKEKPKAEIEAELLQKIYSAVPYQFTIYRSYWGRGWILGEFKTDGFKEEIEGSLEEIYQYCLKGFKEELDDIPF